MKFTCEKYLFQAAVQTASRAASSKSPIPALEGLLVEAGSGCVRITGYDLRKGIYTEFAADIEEPGALIIGARLLGDIVRSLPDGIVRVASEGTAIRIVCGDSDFSVSGFDAADYPELPEVDLQNSISINQKKLSDMIRQTSFAISDNESRPVYTGSLLELKGNTLTIVSVDGFRLALRREEFTDGKLEDCRFVVPGSALSDLEKLCTAEDEDVVITLGAKYISFAVGRTVLISRRLEGEFLDYEKSVPDRFAHMVEVRREELASVVSRVSLIVEDKNKTPLHVTFGTDEIRIHCMTGIGKADDRCPMKGDCGGLEIGFNNTYLLEALRAAPASELNIGINTGSSPCVILPTDDSRSFAYMILPVRLRAGT